METTPILGRKRLHKRKERDEDEGYEQVGKEEKVTSPPPEEPKKLKLRLKLGGETTSHSVTLEYDPATKIKEEIKEKDKLKQAKEKDERKEKEKRDKEKLKKEKVKDKVKPRKEDDEDDDEEDELEEDLEEEDLMDEEVDVDDEEEQVEQEDEFLSIDGDEELDEFSMMNRKLTSRQMAMQGNTGASDLLSLPMEDKKKSGKGVLTEEARLRKVTQAVKRKMKQDEEQTKIRDMVISQLLSRTSKPKNGDEDGKQMPKKYVLHTKDIVSYISGPKGSSLSFPLSASILPIPPQKARYPPPPTKCAAPNCSNPKRYNCSHTKLPICSIECYKIVNANRPIINKC